MVIIGYNDKDGTFKDGSRALRASVVFLVTSNLELVTNIHTYASSFYSKFGPFKIRVQRDPYTDARD